MRPDFRRLLGITLLGTVIAGCVIVSRPVIDPYRAPDSSLPSAQLVILPMERQMPRNHSEQLNRHDIQCQPNGEQNRRLMGLAWFGSSSPAEPVAVALPEGRSYFQYVKEINRESCTINFSAQLEAGHAYALKTQVENKGWLKGSSCRLGMFDVNTRQPVQLDYEGAAPSHRGMCAQQAQR
jgi:hypothetical protein